jgi:hypothetical protein
VRGLSTISAVALALACGLLFAPALASGASQKGQGTGTMNEAIPPPLEESGRTVLDQRYVTLAPVLLSVIRHDDVHKLVTLMITLELGQPGQRTEVELQMPRLRDAYISDLQRLLSLGIYDNRPIDLVLIKKRLLAISQRMMGKDTIRDVLILNAMERGI